MSGMASSTSSAMKGAISGAPAAKTAEKGSNKKILEVIHIKTNCSAYFIIIQKKNENEILKKCKYGCNNLTRKYKLTLEK